MLLAWSQVEFNLNQLLARENALFHSDGAFQSLVRTPKFGTFGKRLRFLLERGVVSPIEYQQIRDFADYRNQLFHGDDWAFFVKEHAERTARMDQATGVAALTMEILFR